MDTCQHVTENYGIVHIRETKTRRKTGRASQQHVLLERPGICQLVNTMKSSVPDHKLGTPIWRFTAAQLFAYFQRQPAALACRINVARSSDFEAVELPIIGFSIVIYHYYDVEVGGPLEEP